MLVLHERDQEDKGREAERRVGVPRTAGSSAGLVSV